MQMDMRGRGTLGNLRGYQFANVPSEHGRDLLDGARETLVTLRIIVLQTDLELHRLNEVAVLFAAGIGK
jgi:hypothetical protein